MDFKNYIDPENCFILKDLGFDFKVNCLCWRTGEVFRYESNVNYNNDKTSDIASYPSILEIEKYLKKIGLFNKYYLLKLENSLKIKFKQNKYKNEKELLNNFIKTIN